MSALNNEQKNLLDALVEDENKADKNLYSAGPYWDYKTKKILYWLKKKGLNDFRGLNSGVGTSYADNIILDIRNELGFRGRLLSSVTYLPFIRKIYDAKIKKKLDNINEFIEKNKKYYVNNERVKFLISKYKIEQSTEFGCKLKFEFNNKDFSCHYLNICDRIEIIDKIVNIKKIKTYFEIGGGFGTNIHLLLNNFNNIKKVIYLDMVPNLFVGTEYLKFFFKDAVKDYSYFRNKEDIKFSSDDSLEIFCIPPWKIKNISSKVDHFHNSASFQEMTMTTVKNYANFILKLLNKDSALSLIVYDGFKRNKTLSPSTINNIFDNKLNIQEFTRLNDNQKKNFLLISK